MPDGGGSVKSGGSGGTKGSGGSRGRGRPPQNADCTLVTKPKMVGATFSQEGGTPMQLLANFIRVITPAMDKATIYDYHVNFDPPLERVRIRRALLWEARGELGTEAILFDGDHNLKMPMKLEAEVTTLEAKDKVTQEPIKMMLKRVGTVEWSSPEMMRLLAVQARRNLQHLKYILLGRHFFDPTSKKRIQEQRIEIWQGVQTALHAYDGGVMLMSETVHKVVRGETAAECMQQIFKSNPGGEFHAACRREMINSVIMTSYNQKTYKISDIAFDKTPLFEFERKAGRTTIKAYYSERYGVTINDDKQPLLVVIESKKKGQHGAPSTAGHESELEKEILLVPSLCQMTGLSDSMTADMNLRRNMIKLTQADPSRKVEELRKFIKDCGTNAEIKKEMSRWNVAYDGDLVKLTGKVLPNEQLFMQGPNGPGFAFKSDSADFSREIRGKSMRDVCPALSKWAVLVTGRDGGLVNDFTSTLKKVMQPMGVSVGDPTVIMLDNDRALAYSTKLATVPAAVQMVVCIVPNSNQDRYDAIKKVLTCERAVPSQVVQGKTLGNKKMLMSCCTKIGIQMATKLGAQPWALKIPPANLMVVALTCYKESSKAAGRAGEAAAVVATTNTSLTSYFSRVDLVQSREALAEVFATNIGLALQRWKEKNNRLPERVLIYRDTDSDGQIPLIYTVELPRIRSILEAADESFKTKGWSFILMNKRVGVRFFASSPRGASNPPPGLVVDTVVTRPERYDFYLVSQAARQGTVGPIMFNILEDLTGFKPLHHQALAYKMTHLYYNWPGMIKIPAPCQYAHKLAFQMGTHLHKKPHENLDHLLFYL